MIQQDLSEKLQDEGFCTGLLRELLAHENSAKAMLSVPLEPSDFSKAQDKVAALQAAINIVQKAKITNS